VIAGSCSASIAGVAARLGGSAHACSIPMILMIVP